MGRRSRSRELREHTSALLQDLGDSPGRVASSLARHGVQGRRRSATGCALAAYLAAVMGADSRIEGLEVTTETVRIHPEGCRRWTVVPLPSPARSFVRTFDMGGYPTLVRPDGGVAVSPAVPV